MKNYKAELLAIRRTKPPGIVWFNWRGDKRKIVKR